ncbi:DUF3800 domain-containing protein [Peribacillus acanthi]|uniref:DUF3800 domain-containing protein n=1 Tax=Peribacillus acanthi TaxID=2171554 RepID=UPI000D3EB8FD|nr:DUF3800 domain-containing protein [Peribacillus acanthi]
MTNRWHIYCEESGDKAIPWKAGSSHYYVITAVLVKEEDEQALVDTIESLTTKVLRMRDPIEWKKLDTYKKRDDRLLAKFFKRVSTEGPEFMISNVVCNKHETNGAGLVDSQIFMNYLYGLMFKKISWFLSRTNATAKLVIDRNTDHIAQESLKKYLSDVARYQTGQHPRFSKPKWTNPEDHAILGFSDFISGVSLRALKDYHENVNTGCKVCGSELCIYECSTSNFKYFRSYKYPVEWNFTTLPNWDWRGFLYHPYENKDNYKHIFLPR